jgi:LysM repeat protein
MKKTALLLLFGGVLVLVWALTGPIAEGLAWVATTERYPVLTKRAGKEPAKSAPKSEPTPGRRIEIVEIDKKAAEQHTIKLKYQESIQAISEWTGLSVERILAENPKSRWAGEGYQLKLTLTGEQVNALIDHRSRFHREYRDRFYDQYVEDKVVDYHVAPGDTIQALCKRYAPLEPWVVKDYNPTVLLNALPAGRAIAIPLFKERARGGAGENPNVFGKETVTFESIQVRLGETLERLSDWSGTTLEDLRRDNKLNAGAEVKPGQTLSVRLNEKRAKAFETLRERFAASVLKELEDKYYTVHELAAGESLWSLAQRYKVDAKRLEDYNSDRDFRKLARGTKIRIPKTAAPFAELQQSLAKVH